MVSTRRLIHSAMRKAIFVPILTLFLVAACNKDEDSTEIDYTSAPSVAVTKFTLKPNAAVMANLDSVYFSIDLEHRVIFNADSLPLGTKVTALTPIITYPATVNKAEIVMTGGEVRTGTIDYIKAPSDTIDFTGDVKLILSTSDDKLSQTYTLKVNVHKCVADSLTWDKESVSSLPSRYKNPISQKSVDAGDKIISFIEESNGEYTVASCDNLSKADWTKSRTTLPFTPKIRTLAYAGNTLYILSTEGNLMSSADYGATWNDTDMVWHNIIGAYDSTILGIGSTTGSYDFDIYPRPSGFSPSSLPAGFPTEGYSNLTVMASRWASAPTGFITGGTRDGKPVIATWAYDGESWAQISNTPLPSLQDATVIPYFCYRKTNASWIQTEYSVQLCMGGRKTDGKTNDVVYISFDNGVNWKKADSLMQLPDFVRPGYYADAIIRNTPMSASIDAHWKTKAIQRRLPQRRLQYFVDGNDVEWDCPYIYLFGGYDDQATLNDEIRRAVLARLTFAPLF